MSNEERKRIPNMLKRVINKNRVECRKGNLNVDF